MLEPSLEYYGCLFGTIKCGAIAVPCSPLFGPEALMFRAKDANARVLVTEQDKLEIVDRSFFTHVMTKGPDFQNLLDCQRGTYEPADTRPKDVAVFQYTSGTTSRFPAAVPHYHRSIVTIMPAAVFGRGLRPGDRYFCPSPPTWGHGLWFGTMAPLSLGIAVGAYSGKFSVERFLEGLEAFEIDNLGGMPTIYRLIINSGILGNYRITLRKMHYTGEHMDVESFDHLEQHFGVPPAGGYGSTEVGAVIHNFPAYKDFETRPGSLGKPIPGQEISLLDKDGNEVPQGGVGEIAVKRRGGWFRTKDAAYVDAEGYYWHKGRVDDVIISSGWTISPVEIEDVLKKHEAVKEVAVIGIPDKERGQIVKALIVPNGNYGGDALTKELQTFIKKRLSKHEYPKSIEYIDEIPKTESGKIRRKELRDRHL
jgi:acetyl-CoA synthetase